MNLANLVDLKPEALGVNQWAANSNLAEALSSDSVEGRWTFAKSEAGRIHNSLDSPSAAEMVAMCFPCDCCGPASQNEEEVVVVVVSDSNCVPKRGLKH